MKQKVEKILENFFIAILTFYPLRHIYTGIDLWDTGYNYANFQYMGTEHMDPMWLFSTYLANTVGHFLTKLPKANSLVGMNFYTGLFVSALALMGYFFCTRKLHIPVWIAFLGEMFAISLCWCPTALLYNYLTYVLFLASSILLYLGLIHDNKRFLIAAGVLLGTNVLVRFSNLPEMAMILVVWSYNIILWLEERKGLPGRSDEADRKSISANKRTESKRKSEFWQRLLRHTFWCLLGYTAALAALLAYIQIRYGLDQYIVGIQRLFAMTDNATDYKPISMIMGLVGAYVENLYWFIRFGVIVVGSVAVFSIGRLSARLSQKGKAIWTIVGLIITAVIYCTKICIRQDDLVDPLFGQPIIFKFLLELDGQFLLLLMLCAVFGWMKRVPKVLCYISTVIMIGWLYYRQFCSWSFYSYDSMLRPAILFLMLTMFIAVFRIFHRNSSREDRLISGMIILIILLTSLGSNNGVYPSINNLFLVAPYTLWQSWNFLKDTVKYFDKGKNRGLLRYGLTIDLFPAKIVLIAFLTLCFFQCGMFGTRFVFAEATGVQNAMVQVNNNEILKNVSMPSERARWFTEISDYIYQENMQGEEVILYGNIPALSYYLQMPSAFNPWSDLRSYSYEIMENEIICLEEMISEKAAEKPIIILENVYALYEEEDSHVADSKFRLLLKFMKEQEYEQIFRNEKFAMYR